MNAYRFSFAVPVLVCALLAGCRDEAPTDPTLAPATPTSEPTAALVGAPNTWEQVASSSWERYDAVAGTAVNANGRSILYLFGGGTIVEGQPGLAAVENYNIGSDHWGTKAHMPIGAGGINGVGNINGKLYLAGGYAYNGDGYNYYRSLQVYDPAANTWTFGAAMPVASTSGVAGVIENRLYVLPGYEHACDDCSPVQNRRLYRYTPVQNRWVRLKPSPNFHINGVAGAIKGKLYVTGGFGSGSRALDIYDPATNTWSSGAPLPTGHTGGVGVALGGQFYVIGGGTGEVVAYNPLTNRWVKKAAFPVPGAREMAGAKVMLDGKARIVVHRGFVDFDPGDGRATFVYTP